MRFALVSFSGSFNIVSRKGNCLEHCASGGLLSERHAPYFAD